MASEGPRYPSAAVNLSNSPENTDAWVSPTNVGADDTSEATITAASYDSPDISQILVASNFGFGIPAGSTIDGIIVEIMRRNSAGAASDNRVQLATGTTFGTLVGTNKADTALDWPTAEALKTYGTSSDTWSAGLTRDQVNATGFAVFLSVQADAANTDIQVDFIRVTIHYTEPLVLTPGTASLVTTRFVPTVLTPRLVTPGIATLITTRFTPIVRMGINIVPGIATLVTARFSPTVETTAHTLVIPGLGTLVTSRFAPVVVLSDHKIVIPGIATLVTTGFSPSVLTPRLVTPGTAALTTALFAPSVLISGGLLLVPGTASLILTRFPPTVLNPQRVTPGALALVTVRFSPSVIVAAVIEIGVVIPSESSWFSATASEGSHGAFPSESE